MIERAHYGRSDLCHHDRSRRWTGRRVWGKWLWSLISLLGPLLVPISALSRRRPGHGAT